MGETRRPGARSGAGSGARAGVACLIVGVLGGCGYHPAYGGTSGARYAVVAGRHSTASFEALPAALAGLRSELGAAAALGEGYPRVVLEILRVDERSLGVSFTGTSSTPLARGSEITVVGRAQILTSAEAKPSFDTGDMSRTSHFASAGSPTADAAARSRAVRDAARLLGQALGRAVLGLPEPSEG